MKLFHKLLLGRDVNRMATELSSREEELALAREQLLHGERQRSEGERALLELELEQSRKMEALGRLAGGIAHDFNNLLTVMLGNLEILLNRERPDAGEVSPTHRAFLEQIRDAGDRAAGLTRQLLAFSRKQPQNLELLHLNDIVEQMTEPLSRVIGEDVELVQTCCDEPASVRADPAQIEQVILNLAVNARDSMPRGGTLKIETLRCDRGDSNQGPSAVIRVSDTGEGMSREVQSQIFEPFFTTKETGRGTGLGLATVYGIVVQAGGRIEVDSSPGRGSVFEVFLPAADDSGPTERPAPR